MNIESITNDIKLICVPAKSFPDGILDAHMHIHKLVANPEERTFFGISRPEKDTIIYKAAVEEIYPGEAEKLNCETIILLKGNYVSTEINDFMSKPQIIGQTFQKMLERTDLDPNGYCVEEYLNDKDVKCMIRLED